MISRVPSGVIRMRALAHDDGAYHARIEMTWNQTCVVKLTGLGELMLPLRELTDDLIESSAVAGGIIAAAGQTDIDDPNSRLHMRIDVGICSVDGYHSVDTGKYTLAPMYALEAANRICGPD